MVQLDSKTIDFCFQWSQLLLESMQLSQHEPNSSWEETGQYVLVEHLRNGQINIMVRGKQKLLRYAAQEFGFEAKHRKFIQTPAAPPVNYTVDKDMYCEPGQLFTFENTMPIRAKNVSDTSGYSMFLLRAGSTAGFHYRYDARSFDLYRLPTNLKSEYLIGQIRIAKQNVQVQLGIVPVFRRGRGTRRLISLPDSQSEQNHPVRRAFKRQALPVARLSKRSRNMF